MTKLRNGNGEIRMAEIKKAKDGKVKVPILTKIQSELKAPKSQYNEFGHYTYRNAEDIESTVKPLLKKYGAQLTFDEDYRQVANRIYCVETAHYKDHEQEITVKGWAREAEHKKGMDESQISGSASSYATKYALGKLFLIDDTKDSDSMDNRQSYKQEEPKAPMRNSETFNQKIENAKKYQVKYGSQKETLVSIIKLANSKDDQAIKFLGSWRKKSKQNEAVYQFITKNNIAY